MAFISMEYIEGRSLRDVLRARPLELSEAFDIALQAAQGLAAIHEHGIVHRDFKTQNIMLDVRGVAKILDFGIAKQVEGASPGFSTSGGRVFGTPEYMSPEQIAGTLVDARSDTYALGCVTYEVFTGRPPFQAETPHAILFKHLHEPPPVAPGSVGLPTPLLAPLSRALAKDPGLRHASTGDYIDAVREARQAALGSARSQPLGSSSAALPALPTEALDLLPSGPAPSARRAPPPQASPARRGRWAWLGAAALAVILSLDGIARREPAAEPQGLPLPGRGLSRAGPGAGGAGKVP
jgi:serine/threonine-protein kinase